MKQRCSNPSRYDYKYYGKLGVTYAKEWKSFEQFLNDMGQRPLGTSLDRINPFGNYEPGNCRWANKQVQSQNQRRYYAGRQEQDWYDD